MEQKQCYKIVSVIGVDEKENFVVEKSNVFGSEKFNFFTQACLDHHSFDETCIKISKEYDIENQIHFNDYMIHGKYDIHWRVFLGKVKSHGGERKAKYCILSLDELKHSIPNFKYNQKMICKDVIDFFSTKQIKLFNFKSNTLQNDLFVRKRESVVVIVESPKSDQILCLEWNNELHWKSLIGGGIENNDIITSAINEVKEESGYYDMKYIKELQTQCHDKFYAPHKQENRYIVNRGVVMRLNSFEKEDISQKELEKHSPIWINKDEVLDYLSSDLENHKVLFREYLGEEIESDSIEDIL